MLQHFRRVLGAAGFAGALLGLVPTPVAAQGPDCAATAQQRLDLRGFRKVAESYADLRSQPGATSALLLCLKQSHAELAETLMLFKRRLQAPQRSDDVVERAFLHYVVNASKPRLDERAAADLDRLARSYRQSLLLRPEPDADSNAACGPPPWTLARLRCIGQRANQLRYGRTDVVPVDLLDFDAAATGYSTTHASWMAEMAALAYWDPTRVDQQLRRWGYARLAEIKDVATDTSGFLAAKDRHLVLSFRGTSGFKNFVTDVDVRRVRADWAEGRLHNGFKSALDAVWPQIQSQLGPPQAQQKDIWLSGHSLGAALAQLAALRLSKAGYRVRSVYTFGTPRIGDADFVADYDRRLAALSFPHVNSQDVVTRVPPAVLGFRAAASGRIRQFTGSGHELKELPAEPADAPDAQADWRAEVRRSIDKTTAFLPNPLRPPALRSTQPSAPRTFNLYSATFESGMLDDHGSFEYLFKLVCASIDHELWPVEIRQSKAPAADRPRN